MNHSLVTAVLPFDAGRVEDVKKLLAGMGNPAKADIAARLDGTNCIHFMGIHALRSDEGRAYLIVDASADGGDETALQRLEASIGFELRALILAAGIDMRAQTIAGILGAHTIKVSNGWFGNPGLDFDGSPRMSVKRIKDEAELAARIADILDAPSADPEPLATLQRVRSKLWDDDANKWAFFAEPAPFLLGVPPAPRLGLKSVVGALAAFLWSPLLLAAVVSVLVGWLYGLDWGVGAGLLTFATALFLRGAPPPDQVTISVVWRAISLFFWPLFVVGAIAAGLAWWLAGVLWAVVALAIVGGAGWLLWKVLYLALRAQEDKDVTEEVSPRTELIRDLMERESFTAQNLLAAASTVKPGMLRRLTLRFGLAAADAATQFYSRPGFLTDIGVIHFARWFCLPGTDKLMFFSNYDGAWESYLEDFIERGFRGVTGIWSNTVGFPKTKGLLNKGATDGDRLRRWTRRQMFPVLFWYTAYPTLTLGRIRTNADIRRGLATAYTEKDAEEWLALFGSAPQPVTDHSRPRLTQPQAPRHKGPVQKIDLADVPAPLFGGMSRLRFGVVLLVALHADSAKGWLRQVQGFVTYGIMRDASTALVLGFSSTGLQKLGLKPADLATFPVPFQQGSHAPWRARAIGDTGCNAPDRWIWGGPEAGVDAAIVIYAHDRAILDKFADERKQEILQSGHKIVHQIRLKERPARGSTPPVEPFGYVDGVSQPIIRGLRENIPADRWHQVVEAGEFILGYRDNQGYVPPSPTVLASTDNGNVLPKAPETAGLPPDDAGTGGQEVRHDLGRNGTFLVIRQLEQDVVRFNCFLDKMATKLVGDPRVPALGSVAVKDWLGAKIVGRWKDGSSLTANPRGPGAGPGRAPDNDFIYGTHDAGGWHCPLGAHIRRANPRDSFEPDSKIQLAITNRHRIVRLGRSYEAQNGREHPGLVFMCLNIDIERQFEFVQQTWLLAPSFHELENERDTMLSRHGSHKHFTIPTPSGPLRISRMSDFITVLGSGYFFLPGRRPLQYLATNR
jgi:deferrochelatase/peroxidase EfeB